MRPQINALTSTRAFAAILVFIFHFGHYVYIFYQGQRFFYYGNLAVSYFFVLSGFVLYISYVDTNFRYIDFMKKRIGRIAPAYLLALGLFLVVYFFVYHDAYNDLVARQIVYSTLCIQSYFPDYALCLNTAAWSIPVEMLFYLLFPFLLLLQKKNIRLFVLLTILAYVVTQVSFFIFFKRNFTLIYNWNFFQYHPVMHINQFMIGMVGGYIFKEVGPTAKRYSFLPFLLFCAIVVLIIIKPIIIFYEVGFIAPVFMLFIISTAITNPTFLNFKPFVFLGEISYGIYILQFPVKELANSYEPLTRHFTEQQFFFVTLGLLIIAATISYYLIERPLRRIISNISFGKKKVQVGNP
jgi:peptidoglycan/LPS O-acetylase OafA/YrhL